MHVYHDAYTSMNPGSVEMCVIKHCNSCIANQSSWRIWDRMRWLYSLICSPVGFPESDSKNFIIRGKFMINFSLWYCMHRSVRTAQRVSGNADSFSNPSLGSKAMWSGRLSAHCSSLKCKSSRLLMMVCISRDWPDSKFWSYSVSIMSARSVLDNLYRVSICRFVDFGG